MDQGETRSKKKKVAAWLGAVRNGDANEVLQILRESPEIIHQKDGDGSTALHIATCGHRREVVKILLEHGARVDERDGAGLTSLICAVVQGFDDLVVTLLRAGADIDAKISGPGNSSSAVPWSGCTALLRLVGMPYKSASRTQRADTLRLLVMSGASVNATRPGTGETALNYVVELLRYPEEASALECAMILTSFGANPYLRSGRGYDCFVQFDQLGMSPKPGRGMRSILEMWTSFRWSENCSPQHLDRFIDQRGKVDMVSILCWAAEKGHVALLDSVYRSSQISYPSIAGSWGDKGWQPIHHAAYGGERNAITRLLLWGADIDSITKAGNWTPLLLAADKGRQRSIRLLLERGADILAETDEGKTAFDLVVDGHHAAALGQLVQMAKGINDSGTRSLALKACNKAKLQMEKDEKASGPSVPAPAQSTTELVAAFNGSLSALTLDDGIVQSSTYDELVKAWDNFEFKDRDRRVKIAVLDTGINIADGEWDNPRALTFKDGQPVRDSREPKQRERIKEWQNFCGSSTEMSDIDGHGTQVASIILRLAPRAELYIARICEGDRNRGIPRERQTVSTNDAFQSPQEEVVTRGIRWAIDQKVDVINMSFGFKNPSLALKKALKEARANMILIFSAMSNDGNNRREGAAWPARDSSLSIGIHSCREGGTKSSDFTPPSVPHSPNFMVVGEDVITHWPDAKGGGFRLDSGTSFATPVAVAMAGLILGFSWQRACKKERAELEARGLVDLKELQENEGMSNVLLLCKPVMNRVENQEFSYIHPLLLWEGFDSRFTDDTLENRRKHAWVVIRDGLSQ